MSSVAGSSVMVFVSQLVANAGFLVAVVALARGLGPEGRGTIAFVVVSALILTRVASLGLAEATMVFASQRPSSRSHLLSNLVVTTAGGALVVGGLATALLWALGDGAPAGLGRIEIGLLAIGTVAIALTEGVDQFLLGCGRIVQRAVVAAVTPWIYAALVVGLVGANALSVGSGAAAWVTAMFAGAVALTAIAVRAAPFGGVDLKLLRETVAFGIRAWFGHLASFAGLRVDQILLGFMATSTALGLYAAAVNGSEVLLYFPAAVALTLTPALSRAEPGARHEQTLRTFRLLTLTTAASVVIAALLGPILLPLLFGERFAGSVAPFLWLLPGAFGFTASRVFSSALLASLASGTYSIGPIAALVTGVALDLLLIPSFGAVGAAAAASGAFITGGVVALVAYRGRFPFAWGSLVPGRSDIEMLRRTVARLRSDLAPSAMGSRSK